MELVKAPPKNQEKPGVYVIRHKTSGMHYIGSSACPLNRVNNHIYRLRAGNHTNHLFQKAWNTCNDFYLVVYETSSRKEAFRLEGELLIGALDQSQLLNIYSVRDQERLKHQRKQPGWVSPLKDKKQTTEHIAKRLPTMIANNQAISRVVIADGKEYPSVRECARALKVDGKTVYRRIVSKTQQFSGWSFKEA